MSQLVPPTTEDAIRAEIASAELSMAVDGSFVETSSSHAARELKKRLDQLLGVGKNGVRSPYALTITTTADGIRVYRVGFRPNDGQAMSPTTGEMARHEGPGGLLSPLTAMNTSSTAGIHQRAATRTHSPSSVLPVPGKSYAPKPRSGSMSTSRPSTSTWTVEADKVPLPDDGPPAPALASSSTIGRPRAYTCPQYYRLDNTDLQIYSRTGDSDIFSSVLGWSDAPRDMTRDPRPISERPFLQIEPGAFPFGRGIIYTRPTPNTSDTRRSSLDAPPTIQPPDETAAHDNHEPPSTDTTDVLLSMIKYPTDIFQVLQTYRGRLPDLDVVLESNDTPTARLTTATSAVPETDPRFVILGDIKPPSDTITTSRRKITKPKPLVVPTDTLDGDQRQVMAATIERWVAQLTSELNYDALLDFFLTYRAYVSANDLCHLLISRFHWALEPTVSATDETVRRIVRVRTFIALRYWLSTFFQVDFLPNRALRNEFTSWLNALRKSPQLLAKPDAVIIIQKLRKIVRECREQHAARTDPKSPQSPVERIPAEPTPLNLHALRTAFESSALPTSAIPGNDSDPDLVATTPVHDALLVVSPHPKSTPASPPRKSSLVLPFPRSDIHPPRHQLVPMPMHHGPLTRALVNTMGRIGKWKRGLGARSTMSMVATVGSAGCVDASAYDNDLGLFGVPIGVSSNTSSATVEVVAVRGGVEEYLKMCGLVGKGSTVEEQEAEADADAEGSDDEADGDASTEANDLTIVPAKISEEKEREAVKGRDTPTSTSTPRLATKFSMEMDQPIAEGEDGSLKLSRRASDATQMQLYATTLRDSWLPEPETISIDDADLSDSSSESEIVRRPPRRLPNRRDLEFATARTDSVSSLAAPSSVPSVQSVQSATTPDHTGLGGPIQEWQVDFLHEDSDDGKGPGDAEAALQRLEGQIDAEEQRLRDLKVDKWLKRVQELSLQRNAAGSVTGRDGIGGFDLAALGINFDDETGDEEDEEQEGATQEGHTEAEESVAATDERESVAASSQVVEQSASVSAQASMRPSVEIPSEANGSSSRQLGSNMSPVQDVSSPRQVEAASPRQRMPMQFKKPRAPKDTSFLLQHRSEVIANNLSAIERGLFMAISFEELVMHNWGPQSHELDITDWMQFRTDAAQHRIQPIVQKEGGRDLLTSDILAVRARFNLTTQFVTSEVVLAHPSQRVGLVNKLIRIAWVSLIFHSRAIDLTSTQKLYRMNNFATLCAIITGLNSGLVEAAMRKYWSGVGMWELRVFKDLKWFVSSTDHFRFMRDAIVSATHDAPGTASDKNSDAIVGCIPFLGIYLSELSEYAKLPDFVDPTSPETPAALDPVTGEFAPLHDPEIFVGLTETPSYMPLRPLINVHKQRQISAVVKALVNGQHMASACKFSVEQKVYSRCLRLKCADGATLWRALASE
ncbi:RasGEF domain-containing protein [Ceratobasidium sp. AG-Ba]|nr:RasGEF domain-containing protein [Ceratobasidium sp. AG-Ba]